MKQQRHSGIELLRLLAMFGIVLSHWGGHGSWELTYDNNEFTNKVFLQLTQYLGEVGNCIFLMITGYFLASRDSINTKGLIRIVKDVTVYAFVIWLFVVACGIVHFSISGGVFSLLPIIYSQYWFVTPFLIILILSPWINHLLIGFNEKQRNMYFALLFTVELVLPLVYAKTVSSNLGILLLFYSLGVQLRISPQVKDKMMKHSKKLILYGFGLAIVSIVLLDIIAPVLGLNENLSMHFIGRFSVLPVIAATGLFLLFSNFSLSSPFINSMAQSAFAVYLISENPNIYPWFWKKTFDNMQYYDTPYMIVVALLQCAMVFIVCIIIDKSYKGIQTLIGLTCRKIKDNKINQKKHNFYD